MNQAKGQVRTYLENGALLIRQPKDGSTRPCDSVKAELIVLDFGFGVCKAPAPSLTKETYVKSPTTQQPSGSPIGNSSHPCSSYEAAVVTLLRSKRRASLWNLPYRLGGLLASPRWLTFDGERRWRARELDQHKYKSLASFPGFRSPAGNLGEQGVAILPEENHTSARKNPSQRVKQTDGGMIARTGKRIEHSVALTLVEPLHPADGIFISLSGHHDRTSVTILPDEQKIPKKPHRRFFSRSKPAPAVSSRPAAARYQERRQRAQARGGGAEESWERQLQHSNGKQVHHPATLYLKNYERHRCAAWVKRRYLDISEPSLSTRTIGRGGTIVEGTVEKAARIYESGGLVDEAKALKERVTGTLNRAEEGFSGLMNRRHLEERAGKQTPGLSRRHGDVQGEDKTESQFDNPKPSVVSSPASLTVHLACFLGMILTDGAGGVSPGSASTTNHQDETKSFGPSLEPGTQDILFPPFSSYHTPTISSTTTSSTTAKQGRDDPQPQEQIPSIHFASDEGLIDGDVRKNRSVHGSIPTPAGTSKPSTTSRASQAESTILLLVVSNLKGWEAPSHPISSVA
ncbi:hypothetical protein BKA70DRAFT_1570681 [Coprinopsis sp. MPI-PUGE-AT-0042]|nr:hypothetical protein BKA70DRAFT_1570681 [Coprinopsis sp. MPI-PUGE-AT-0042]